MLSSNWKTVLFAGGSAVLCGIALKVLKKIELFKKCEKQCDATINEFLFYGNDEGEARTKLGTNNLYCIYYLILHATRSIDVCMPSLMSETIAKCITEIYQKGKVKIRIIIHNTEDYEQILTLAENGVEVKMANAFENLGHEFILVDALQSENDAVAIIGSLDYEVGRVNCNRDNTLLTSEEIVINALQKEFDRIWDSTLCNIEEDVDA